MKLLEKLSILIILIIYLKQCLCILDNSDLETENAPKTTSTTPSSATTTTTTTKSETAADAASLEQPEVVDVILDVIVEKTPSTQPDSTSTPQTESTTKTTPIVDVVVNKNKLDMQSFEEWKEMKLKDKPIKHQESSHSYSSDGQSQSSSPSTLSSLSTKLSRQRKNYASLDCGAKIIGHNPDASNPSHVLTESKDDYMLNSCSRRSWFVVELCEPIKITQIELANFELFSNVPRLFRVHASERYIQLSNGKDWPQKYFLGLFEAANIRAVQTFSLSDAKKEPTDATSTLVIDHDTSSGSSTSNSNTNQVIMYAKYVKFEMLSHYGTEHYCPLSLVRVYGTSMAEDEEEVIDLETQEQETHHHQQQQQQQIQQENELRQLEEQNKVSEAISTTSVNENVSQTEQTTSSSLEITLFLNNLISNLLGENFNLKFLFQSKSSQTKPPAISIASSVMRHKKRANFIQNDLHKLICFNSNQLKCCECSAHDQMRTKQSMHSTFNWLPNKCAYYFLISSILNNNKSMIVDYISKHYSTNETTNLTGGNKTNNTQILINGGLEYLISDEWLDTQTSKIQNNSSGSRKKSNNFNLNEINGHNDVNLTQDLENNNNNKNIIDDIHFKMSENSESNLEKNEINDLKNESINLNERISLDETNVERVNESNLAVDPAEPTTTSTTTPMMETTTPLTTTIASSTPVQSNSNNNNVVNEQINGNSSNETVRLVPNSTSSQQKPPAQNYTPPQQPIIIANGKEAVFMRLSNRIKILELNMSLSSQYLEKLSQHYRTQMDEMEIAFNKTTTALIDTTRIANERDHKQHEKITALEKRLDKLAKNYEALSSALKDLKLQIDLLSWFVLVCVNLAIIVQLVKCLISTKHSQKNIQQVCSNNSKQSKKVKKLATSTNHSDNECINEDDDFLNERKTTTTTTSASNSPILSSFNNNLALDQLESLIETKLKLILDEQQQQQQQQYFHSHSHFHNHHQQPQKKEKEKTELKTTNNETLKESNSGPSSSLYLQPPNAAAAAATLAVVAATLNYSLAATCTTLNQTNDEIDSFKPSQL